MKVCTSCSKLGEPPSQQLRPDRRQSVAEKPRSPLTYSLTRVKPRSLSRLSINDLEELTLVPDYSTIVKRARERMKLTQEELGRLVGEKASVISKIETGRLRPSIALAKKLEHVLRVKLVESIEEIEDSL